MPRVIPEAAAPGSPAPALRFVPSLRRNFAWTLAGNVVYAGCQWGMLVVLAKLGNQEGLGQFSLGLALTAPVLMLTNLNLRSVQATDARHEHAFGDYLGLRLVATVVALLVIIAVTLLAGYDPATRLVILAVGLAKAIESVSDVFYGLLQKHERMDRISLAMMAKGLLSLAALAITILVTGSVLWGTVALGACWALVLAAYEVRSGARVLGGTAALRPRWQPRVLTGLTVLSLPLGLVMFLVSLNTNIPRYFVERDRGLAELGVFAALSYLMVAGSTVVNALGQAVTPRLARYYAASQRRAFFTLLGKATAFGALLGGAGVLAALVAGRWLLTLLYRPEYAEHTDVFTWLMLAAGLGYVASFLGYGMTAARVFRAQLPLFAVVSLGTLAACAVLIPRAGLHGAAVAVTLAAVLQLAGSAAVLAAVCVRRTGVGG
jgi:O-antigen/teichoic acid export membrane protein